MENMLNKLEVTGRSRTHVVQFAEPRFAAQPEVVQAFLAMRGPGSGFVQHSELLARNRSLAAAS
jgi:hypothetical protein